MIRCDSFCMVEVAHAQMRVYDMEIKEKQERRRGGGEGKKMGRGPGLNGNFKWSREACSRSSAELD